MNRVTDCCKDRAAVQLSTTRAEAINKQQHCILFFVLIIRLWTTQTLERKTQKQQKSKETRPKKQHQQP
jgi:cell division protein FtsI/penicillin-binding protein 2